MKEETLRQQVVRILPCHVAIKPIHQEEVVALVEETQIQAFNRGCESVRAQAKAEKAPIDQTPALEYMAVSRDDPDSLGVSVEDLIKAGWRPQGGLAIKSAGDNSLFCQAMIRGGKE